MSPPCDVFARSVEDAWMQLINTPAGDTRGVWLRPTAATRVGWYTTVAAAPCGSARDRWVLVGYYNRGATLACLREAVFHVLEQEVRR